MKKSVLCLFLLGGSYLPLRAQIAPATATTPATAPAPAPPMESIAPLSAGRQDTLRALGNMFERRRKGGKTWLYVAAGGTLAFVRAATAQPASPSPYVTTSGPDAGGLAVVFGAFAGLPAAVGVSKLVRFTEAKQQELEKSYRGGKPLPKSMASRLKAKDF